MSLYEHIFFSTRMPLALLLLSSLASEARAQATWINSTTGDWFAAGNWNPAAVPTSTVPAMINNGGEALADVNTATGSVTASRIDVGKNGGTGSFTVQAVDMVLGGSLDVADVELGFASSGQLVISSGQVTLRDSPQVLIGTAGSGDLDIGQTYAQSMAEASGTGTATIERINLLQIASDLDVAESGGTGQATGQGTLVVRDTASVLIGGSMDVAETGSGAGMTTATADVEFDAVGLLSLAGDLDLARIFSSGGQNRATAGLRVVGPTAGVQVGGSISAGLAGTSAGGLAESQATLTMDGADLLSTGSLLGVGYVRNTAGSGSATAVGSATITDVGDITIGTQAFVGRSFANDDVVGVAEGTLWLERIGSLNVTEDLDVGRTGAIGTAATGLGSASGRGAATILDVAGLVHIGGDADIGQTSAVAGGVAHGDGTLRIERVAEVAIDGDLDVAQVSGPGWATAIGSVEILTTPRVTIGGAIDAGQTNGSTQSTNRGQGHVTVHGAELSVGFGDPLLAGGLDIGGALAAGSESADATGSITLDQVRLDAAGRITVGGLSGGSGNASTRAYGSLVLVSSAVAAPSLEVAVVTDGTAGMATGYLQLDSTLLDISGALTLGNGSHSVFTISGSLRADGTAIAGQYAAIDAASAVLDGSLRIGVGAGFAPAPGSLFDVLRTSGGYAGDFDSIESVVVNGVALAVLYQPTDVVVLAALLGDLDTDTDVDFDDIDDFVLGLNAPSAYQGLYGLPSRIHGDLDQDGDHDFDDIPGLLAILSGASSSLRVLAVPEPASVCLALCGLLALCGHRWPHRRGFSLVEVLVVIAILGVLMSLLLPAVQAARERARNTQCVNHLKQIGLAFQNHLNGHGYFPSGGWNWTDPPTYVEGAPAVGEPQKAGWGFQILPFLEASTAWQNGPLAAISTPHTVFFCPSRRAPQTVVDPTDGYIPPLSGAALQHALCDYAASNREMTGAVRRFRPLRLAEIVDGTSMTCLAGDKRMNIARLGQMQDDDNEGYTVGWNSDTIRWTNHAPEPDHDGDGDGGDLFGSSHVSGFNMGFVDGSVRKLAYSLDDKLFRHLGNIADGNVLNPRDL